MTSRSLFVAILAGLAGIAISVHAGQPRVETDLSGPGWKLWLDKGAKWEADELFLPPVDVTKLPVNLPTDGWDALKSNAHDVSVPGTVEEYLHSGNGPEGDIKGVSWWTREFKIPGSDSPRRLLLHFDAVRLRAEIFVNHKLVGYDVIGNTPFDVDITDAVRPGEDCELAVRVTDPGGNFDWRDSAPFMWGTNTIPMSHGFGGVTGRVRLVSCDPVFVDDVYVQNTPAITNVDVIATVKNTTDENVRRDVEITVTDKANADRLNELLKSGGIVDYLTPLTFSSELTNVELKPGPNTVTFHVSAPRAGIWDLEHPNLYVCKIGLNRDHTQIDQAQQIFGFRWFAPEGVGTNAMFRLNGKRIVLRTSISWGFWPINGIFPTPELAKKQIESAKALGLNMLNFHRAIGQPEVLDDADKLGLLYYEEPGAYVNGDKTPFAKALAREKLLRMVKRDRSHPSLVIYNMINEAWDSGGASRDTNIFNGHVRDMRDAHALDPSRTIVHTSAWALKPDDDEMPKMHMRPFDDVVHMHGWFDNHHAGGPGGVEAKPFYKSPNDFYNRTTNRSEIVYWGEEGAISSPPRLEKIKAALDAARNKGWDGAIYLDWYRRFDDFLTRKNLRGTFPTVDALTTSMGAVSLYHQGRKIETLRINDEADGYAVNGWESESVENHSGIVDCWRNPKGDPAIMAYYNQPLYVAVKTRSQFVQIPGKVAVDFYAINEKSLHGPHTLEISARDPTGREIWSKEIPVSLTGGDVFGELLKDNVTVPIVSGTGIFRIEANLQDAADEKVASGHDEVLAVDWKSEKMAGKGATWESVPRVRDFLQTKKELPTEAYRDDLGTLDWVVVTRPPSEGEPVEMSADNFSGDLATTFASDGDFQDKFYQRSDKTVDYFVPDGAAPDQHTSVVENYGIRWEGKILPTRTGNYTFATESSDGLRLWVQEELLFNTFREKGSQNNQGRIHLDAGKPVSIRLEFWHNKGNAQCKLLWAVPEADAPDPKRLIERVRNDGTTLFILDRADTWMNLITNNTSVKYNGSFKIGTQYWLRRPSFRARTSLCSKTCR